MTIQDAQKVLTFQLYHLYDDSEAAAIADRVMEHITGWKRIDRILHKQVRLSEPQREQLAYCIRELSLRKPVQYVLHEAWFCGLPFYVNEHVLIPRPETEELVEWVASDHRNLSPRILDIGTGSGCIAIALQKKMPRAILYGCDISTEALEVARKNAVRHQVNVTWIQADVLQQNMLPEVDVIVSNPPYIPLSEKSTMSRHVVEHEPHLALFVEDGDPLKFYHAIRKIPATKYYFEVHQHLAAGVAALFDISEIRKDINGNERMVKSSRI